MSVANLPRVPYVRRCPDPKSKTGHVGVSYTTRKFNQRRGVVTRTYFQAEMTTNLRKRKHPFCIETLGYDAAHRAAVRCRERWELEAAELREVIKPARLVAKRAADKQRIAANPGPRREYEKNYKAQPSVRAKNRAYWHRVGKQRRQQKLQQQKGVSK